jgi:hypothetical protein
MSDDVDVLTETLNSRLLTLTEDAALARVEQFVWHHDFATQRRPRLALELLLAGLVAAVAVTLIVALTRHALPTPSQAHHTPVPVATATASPSTPSPSAALGPAIPMRIVQQLSLGARQANALSVSPGIVWVAALDPVYGDTGRLLRIDASTAHETGSWAVGGDPVAVSAVGGYVWVANSAGDGSLVLPDENTVMQFNAVTGALVHLYRIAGPVAVVANRSGALVVSSPANDVTDISLLTAGRSSLVATVPGYLQGPSVSAESALAVCGGEVYLGVSELTASGAQSINIYGVRVSGGPARTVARLQAGWWPVMTCDSTALFVFDAAGDAPVVVNPADGRTSTLSEGAGASAVGFESGLVWQLHNGQGPLGSLGYVTALDPDNGRESSSRLAIPGTASSEAFLLVPGSSGLWLVGGNEALLLHVTFG